METQPYEVVIVGAGEGSTDLHSAELGYEALTNGAARGTIVVEI